MSRYSWRKKKPRPKCKTCGKETIDPPSYHRKYCSKKCAGVDKQGNKNIWWKGTREIRKCKRCGKEFYAYKRKDKKREQKYCSIGCHYETNKGSNNFWWKGGLTPEYNLRFCSKEWRNTIKSVYKRDNYTCVICFKKVKVLHAHHIVPYRITQDNSLENLITLCASCHRVEENSYYKRN